MHIYMHIYKYIYMYIYIFCASYTEEATAIEATEMHTRNYRNGCKIFAENKTNCALNIYI